MKRKSINIKNAITLLEAVIDDELLREVIALKAHHPDKETVIKECVEELRTKFPEVEIFKVGPDYIVTETSMYIALFDDELKLEE